MLAHSSSPHLASFTHFLDTFLLLLEALKFATSAQKLKKQNQPMNQTNKSSSFKLQVVFQNTACQFGSRLMKQSFILLMFVLCEVVKCQLDVSGPVKVRRPGMWPERWGGEGKKL